MRRSLASWKLLEDLILELKKSGVAIPLKVVEDLRVAKSLIELSCMNSGSGEVMQKTEMLFVAVEAYLIAEGQKKFGEAQIDGWIKRLEVANTEPPLVTKVVQKQFVVGVPKDQQWIRIEPAGTLSAERVEQLAKRQGMAVKLQNDGKLVIYGSPVGLKVFIQEITTEKLKP
jgi:hypothetical protein